MMKESYVIAYVLIICTFCNILSQCTIADSINRINHTLIRNG